MPPDFLVSVTGCPSAPEVAEGLASLLLPQPYTGSYPQQDQRTSASSAPTPRFCNPLLAIPLGIYSRASVSILLKPIPVFLPVPKHEYRLSGKFYFREAEGMGAFEQGQG